MKLLGWVKITKRRIVFAIIAFLIFGAVMAYRNFSKSRKEEPQSAQIQKGTVTDNLILSGTILADEHVNLQFQASGLLTYVGVKEGDLVKKGKVIASLDSKSLKKSFQKYMNIYTKTRNTFEQAFDDNQNYLIEPDAEERERLSRVLWGVQMDLNNSVLDVEITDIAVRLSSLVSPITGVVTKITDPLPGININAGQTRFEIVNPSTIFFEVVADQTEVTLLKLDQEVAIILDSFPDMKINGKVKLISYTPDPTESGTVYQVKVVLDDPFEIESGIRIGMTGDAKFLLAKKDNVLYVPSGFVNSDSQGTYINLGSAGNRVYVQTGLEGEEVIEIIGSFAEGDTVFD